MIHRIVRALLATLAVTAFVNTPAFAGNIALTGHDDDFHGHFDGSSCTIADDACTQLAQLTAFVRAGSSNPGLKVLVFDMNPPGGDGTGTGNELTSSLTGLGIAFDAIATPAGVTDALFDPTKYSAFIVASDNTCGGCDNDPTMTAALKAHTTALDNFFNAGGGILALAGGDNAGAGGYYSFLPVSAVGAGSPPSSGFVGNSSCFGTAVTGVNGDATHNFFSNPGTGGVSPLFCVAENNPGVTSGPNAVTLLLKGGAIVTSVITTSSVPEPATLSLFGLGGLVAAYRRRRRS
jgi:hypothetical protein